MDRAVFNCAELTVALLRQTRIAQSNSLWMPSKQQQHCTEFPLGDDVLVAWKSTFVERVVAELVLLQLNWCCGKKLPKTQCTFHLGYSFGVRTSTGVGQACPASGRSEELGQQLSASSRVGYCLFSANKRVCYLQRKKTSLLT